MKNKTSFVKLGFMIARLIFATGILILCILFEGQGSIDAEPLLAAIYIEAVLKRNTGAASTRLLHLCCSKIAIALS